VLILRKPPKHTGGPREVEVDNTVAVLMGVHVVRSETEVRPGMEGALPR